MITNSREQGFPAKKESKTSNDGKITKGASSSRQWLGLKDPRVVRVSRSFGGKDRHSKVCTIRGLRDRRVRLSVPTAIQLYDLQDRLGLNQPSKVVDWLLDAAKHDIDELPPLQIPPGNFGEFPQSNIHALNSNLELVKNDGSLSLMSSSKEGDKINDSASVEHQTTMSKSTLWNLNVPLQSKLDEVVRGTNIDGKCSWMKESEQESLSQEGVTILSSHNPQPRANTSFPSLANNIIPYNPYYNWDPSHLYLSNLGAHGYLTTQSDDHHNNYNLVTVPSPLPVPSFFSPYITTQGESNNPRQINQLQMASSSSQDPFANSLAPSLNSGTPPMRPLQFGITSRILHSQISNEGNRGPSNTLVPPPSFHSHPTGQDVPRNR
ncbi:hypothetical protein GIB67_038662 [Kingdonia uniflora]|uniref:TCP domain-containing protein n=1 Tax=Kingdonia uniflora TaxID=39325 RepID=A0A7J7NPQ0_9MAGN|nr:hypothetical protein GIB67_038662 [Kingdonia uniflora]